MSSLYQGVVAILRGNFVLLNQESCQEDSFQVVINTISQKSKQQISPQKLVRHGCRVGADGQSDGGMWNQGLPLRQGLHFQKMNVDSAKNKIFQNDLIQVDVGD